MWAKRNGVLSRKLRPTELFSICQPSRIQLALDIEDPNVISKYVDILNKIVASLHLRCDYSNVYQTPKKSKVFHLPENLTKLDDCIAWSLMYAPVESTWPLATIAVNSHKLVLNSTHAFMDGGGFVNIVNELLNPTVDKPITPLQMAMEDVFADEISNSPPDPLGLRDKTFTHFKETPPKSPDFGDVLELVPFQSPVEHLACYNNGKVKGLTEWISTAMILASKAMHDLGDEFGIQTAINLRQYLPPERITWNTTSLSLSVGMRAGYPNTVDELLLRLRKSLNEAVRTKQALKALKWMSTSNGMEDLPHQGLILYLSNVGQIRIKRPIRDVMMRVNQESPDDATCTISYSVISDTANIVKTHTMYGREYVTNAKMREFVKLYSYGLQHLKRNMTIEEAINLLKRQRSD